MSEQDSVPGNSDDGTNDADIIKLGGPDGGTASPEGFIDPAATAPGGSDSGSDQPRRGRGRPRGSGKKSAPKNTQVDLDSFFTSCLFGIHQMAASFSKIPELELDEGEAARLAKHTRHVLAQYTSIEVDPKTQAWIGLAIACGGIYGPRYIAMKIRRDEERAARMAARGAQQRPAPAATMPQNPVTRDPATVPIVVPFPPPPSGSGDFGGGGSGAGVA